MRKASTADITEEIQLNLISSNCQTATKLEVYVNDIPQVLNELDESAGIDWTESGKKQKSFKQTLTPLAGEISFNVVNEKGKFSTGSGTTFEDILDNETKIRFSAGYFLDSAKAEETESLNLNNVSGLYPFSQFYHTQYTSNYVYLDISSETEIPSHFTDIFIPFYDSETYDDSNYSPDAYNIQTYDTGGSNHEQINSFDITCNNTEGTVYYRSFNNSVSLDKSTTSQWESVGATVDGTKSIILSTPIKKRFFQVAVVYDGVSWSDDLRITNVTIYKQSFVEFMYKSVYYLDTPEFTDPEEPEIPMIYCNGRDAWKRAIAKEINIPDMSGGGALQVDELIKEIADQINMPYTSSSIADLSAFSDITWSSGLADLEEADEVFELCMQKTLSTGYQMYLKYDDTEDENILFVTQQPDALEADGAFNYNNYINIDSTRKNNDKMLQRITIITDQQVVNAKEQLAQTAFTTTGAKTMSWSGNAAYKDISIDKPDDITISGLSVSPTQIDFTIDSITGTVTVTVDGNKWKSTNPTYEGEAINLDNMIKGKGSTSRLVNPLFISDNECKTQAEAFITNFSSPVFEARGLTWPYVNLIPEINDVFLMWRRFFFRDNLYFITGVSHHWDRDVEPTESTSFNLEDSGRNYSEQSSFIWDDSPVLNQYDKGYVWDMGISTPINTDDEINAIADALVVHNVDTV
jgi:hypothetical protein